MGIRKLICWFRGHDWRYRWNPLTNQNDYRFCGRCGAMQAFMDGAWREWPDE